MSITDQRDQRSRSIYLSIYLSLDTRTHVQFRARVCARSMTRWREIFRGMRPRRYAWICVNTARYTSVCGRASHNTSDKCPSLAYIYYTRQGRFRRDETRARPFDGNCLFYDRDSVTRTKRKRMDHEFVIIFRGTYLHPLSLSSSKSNARDVKQIERFKNSSGLTCRSLTDGFYTRAFAEIIYTIFSRSRGDIYGRFCWNIDQPSPFLSLREISFKFQNRRYEKHTKAKPLRCVSNWIFFYC